MSDTRPTKQQLLDAIRRLSEKYPDWRIGQLLGNLTIGTDWEYPGGVCDVEDEQLLKRALELLRD